MHAYDRWWASFIGRLPQMEGGGGVQNLLSDLSSVETEDPGTDFLDFRKILFVQLEPSFTEGCLRRPGGGSGLSLLGFQFLSYLGGCGTILGTACRGLVAALQEFKGKSDFEASKRLFLLWGGLISLIRVSVGSLTDLLLDLLTGL